MHLHHFDHREKKIKGIVLRAIPLQEEDKKITTLFTPEGKCSVVVDRLQGANKGLLPLTTPITEGEFLLKATRGETFKLIEASVTHPHLFLRNDLERLSVAFKILALVERSQMPGKKAPLLYHLTVKYIDALETQQIQSPSWPWVILGSFTLKLLKHEGIYMEQGESEEKLLYRLLAETRQFTPLHALSNSWEAVSAKSWVLHLEKTALSSLID